MKDELFESLMQSVQQADDILKNKQKAEQTAEIKLPKGASLIRTTVHKKS
ncbi:hypothetical protein [Bacterioplanoides sp.]